MLLSSVIFAVRIDQLAPVETAAVKSSARAAGNAPVRANLPKGVYKKMTELKPAAELKTIEVELISGDQFKERADKFVERFLNQTR